MSGFSSALVLSRSECSDGPLLLSSFNPSLCEQNRTLTSCTERKEKKNVIKSSICASALKGRRLALEELSDNRGGHGGRPFFCRRGQNWCFVGGGIQRDGEMQLMHNETNSGKYEVSDVSRWESMLLFLKRASTTVTVCSETNCDDGKSKRMKVENTHMLWVWLVWSVKSACQRPTSHACERVAPSFSSMPSRAEPSRAGVKTAAYQVRFRGAVKTFPPPRGTWH